MELYYVASSRKVCFSDKQAVTRAVEDMRLYLFNDKTKFEVSKPMIVVNRWNEHRVVVSIYDKRINKLMFRTRLIKIIDPDKEKYIEPIEYLGQF